MAIAIVQSQSALLNPGGSGGTGTVTLGGNVTSGNAVAISYAGYNGSFTGGLTLGIQDNMGNVYSPPSPFNPNGDSFVILGNLCQGNITNSPHIFTFTLGTTGGGTSPILSPTVMEVSGLGINPVIADVAGIAGQFTNSASASMTNNGITTAYYPELALASVTWTGTATDTWTQNNGWTQQNDSTGVGDALGSLTLSNIFTSSGAQALQMTPSVSLNSFIQINTWASGGATVAWLT